MRIRIIYLAILRTVARFVQSQRGNVGIIFGVSIVPLFALSLGAMQYGEALVVKRSMCNAVDAAVLLAAANPDKPLSHLQGKTDHIFLQDFAKKVDDINGLDLDLNYFEATDSYSYLASGNLDTPLYNLVGIDSMVINCRAEAQPERNGLEIVFALDTTGSMGFGSSWSDATAAMAEILPSMLAMSDNSEFFVSFFPFSDRVNIGKTPHKWNDWLGDKYILKKNNGTPKNLEYGHWKGCVEPRPADPTVNNWKLDDESPLVNPFIPSATDMVFDRSKSHLDDGGLVNKSSSYSHCNSESILGPTKDPSDIMTSIENISLKGTGRFDIGMAWAWRMVSPKWRDVLTLADEGHFGYPSQYGERRKVVVFITDAFTTAYGWEVCDDPGVGGCTEYGYNKGSLKGFENMVDVCTKMKNEGIEIHTIYVNGNQYGVPFLQECATNIGSYYHAVTNVAELSATLEKIKSSLSNVRLTK